MGQEGRDRAAVTVPGDPAEDAGLPGPVEVGTAEREALLDVARTALSVASGAAAGGTLERRVQAALGVVPARRTGAAFVTLTVGGELRGCMGLLEPDRRLVETVARAAVLAAGSDPRFEAVEPSELPDIEIEVSVLGPMSPLDDPLAFRLGTDGVMVERGGRRGLLLPEVATDAGLDAAAMLETCCRKAGLPGRSWADGDAVVLAFRTCRFGGPATAAPPRG